MLFSSGWPLCLEEACPPDKKRVVLETASDNKMIDDSFKSQLIRNQALTIRSPGRLRRVAEVCCFGRKIHFSGHSLATPAELAASLGMAPVNNC
jgi:hypothetical protein